MRARFSPALAAVGLTSLMLTACTGSGFAPASGQQALASPTIRPDEFAGRWGYAAYYKEADRVRVEAAARGQCSARPIEISRGPAGGIMMPIANQPQAAEVTIKGGPGGKNYIGPPGRPVGAQDNEVVSFDGSVLLLRTATPDEVGSLYSVYVRCGAAGRS